MKRTPLLPLACLLFTITGAFADEGVRFIGQFGNKAVISIDGKQRVLAVGQTSREGVKVLTVDATHADILYQGRKQRLGFSQRPGGTYKPRGVKELSISTDAWGSFRTPGSINGQLVNFLVDTGASTVAMNEKVARKLGIDFRYSGTPSTVATASGVVPAYSIRLDSVKVGEIELNNVPATVIEGDFPLEVLLGMSFLSRLEMERKGKLITLRKTH